MLVSMQRDIHGATAEVRPYYGLKSWESHTIPLVLPPQCEGINMVKRKLAEHDNLKITIEQNGDKFHIKESSTFRTKDNDFTLGIPFEYTLADGTEVAVGSRRSKVLHSALLSPLCVLC